MPTFTDDQEDPEYEALLRRLGGASGVSVPDIERSFDAPVVWGVTRPDPIYQDQSTDPASTNSDSASVERNFDAEEAVAPTVDLSSEAASEALSEMAQGESAVVEPEQIGGGSFSAELDSVKGERTPSEEELWAQYQESHGMGSALSNMFRGLAAMSSSRDAYSMGDAITDNEAARRRLRGNFDYERQLRAQGRNERQEDEARARTVAEQRMADEDRQFRLGDQDLARQRAAEAYDVEQNQRAQQMDPASQENTGLQRAATGLLESVGVPPAESAELVGGLRVGDRAQQEFLQQLANLRNQGNIQEANRLARENIAALRNARRSGGGGRPGAGQVNPQAMELARNVVRRQTAGQMDENSPEWQRLVQEEYDRVVFSGNRDVAMAYRARTVNPEGTGGMSAVQRLTEADTNLQNALDALDRYEAALGAGVGVAGRLSAEAQARGLPTAAFSSPETNELASARQAVINSLVADQAGVQTEGDVMRMRGQLSPIGAPEEQQRRNIEVARRELSRKREAVRNRRTVVQPRAAASTQGARRGRVRTPDGRLLNVMDVDEAVRRGATEVQ